ncbi:Virulence factor BrkB [Rubritalea squalenifaciens DSM 18772]|uniref:Virulence factor BrkB n=1 Tax=Rubritalea squalenifaciens DSM 18772 TaxID=1123071 RepID=A0A1M6EXT6_9BACT|nr:YihY/virulence factor BrkB family protein [Rubritalea squalenifaciens]SHI90245.1 Virulence factor BrkB [Rubritalea squalenifaciens DSM 18772]
MIPWAKRILKAARNWWVHGHANEAAALAFYSLFSLIPILVIGLTVASWIVDKETALRSLLERTTDVTGFSVTKYLSQILSQDLNWIGSGVSPILGGILLAFSATKVITELRRSLSKVFGTPLYKKRSHAALANLMGRFTSLILIVMLGISIASAVIYETVIALIKNSLSGSPFLLQFISILSPIITLAAMTLLTAIVMRWLPKRPPKFREALVGGFASSLLLVVLKFGLTTFLQHAHIGDIYGGALTLVLLLLWVYFVMQAVLYGAELAATLANERRSLEDHAVEDMEGSVTEYRNPQSPTAHSKH